MKNADKIRNMNNDELIEFLNHSICDHTETDERNCIEDECRKCIRDWLEKESN